MEEFQTELGAALEAIIFAAGEPLPVSELKKVCARAWKGLPEEEIESRLGQVKDTVQCLKEKWGAALADCGFQLVEVGDGLTFRSSPSCANYLLAMREERPVRLSKAALETLAIIAYRQPATKPEIDHIRGVDCGGTIRMLLDRSLVRIVGKKEEPGRPLMYGTTKDFLTFFNISSLNQLPSLREFHELNEESAAALNDFDGGEPSSLRELSESAKQLRLEEEPAMQALDEAVESLDTRESRAVDAFRSEGIEITPDVEAEQTTNP